MSVRKRVVNCKVSGCEAPAAVEVYWCDEYSRPNIKYRSPYIQCQYMCEEHLYINESGRVGKVEPRGIAAYPFVNRGAIDQGWCEYQWLDNGEMVARRLLPLVEVALELMPPPILNVQNEIHSADGIERWFLQRCMGLAKK